MTHNKDSILISIQPKFVSKILTGEKKYEYRKRIPETVKKMVIYSSSPEQCIVAVAAIKKIHYLPLKELWQTTSVLSGISKRYFNEYFNDREYGYGLEIDNVNILETPLLLKEVDFNLTPPQSFRYVEDSFIEQLLSETVSL